MKQKQTFLSETAFLKRLNSHPYENTHILKTVENDLTKLRGYVYKPPKPHASVILLVSGGIDSIVAWGTLLSVHKLSVYPLYIHRGTERSEKEQKAVEYFSGWFKDRFPALSHNVFMFSTKASPPELERWMNIANHKKYHPNTLLEQINKKNNPFAPVLFNPLQPMPLLFPIYGLMYAQYLKNRYDMAVNTIYTGNLPGDGTLIQYQTHSAIRTTTLLLAQTSGMISLQISSPFFEKTTGTWIEKNNVIKHGMVMKIPLDRTWSCYYGYTYHCGVCHSCFERKKQFAKVGFDDSCIYKDPTSNPIKRMMNKSHIALHNLLQYMRKKGGI